jgi:glycosyltransferase involved in cell wall biosynthesis
VTKRLTVLTLAGHYVPSFRAGGPVRSLANLTDALGDEFDFRIAAFDRDMGSATPYADVESEAWHRIGRAWVTYIPPGGHAGRILALLRRESYDVAYLNTFFDPAWGFGPIAARRVGAVQRRGMVIAPRGQFMAGAMRRRHALKRAAIWVGRGVLSGDEWWQATDDAEAMGIRGTIGRRAKIALAPNIPGNAPPVERRRTKTAGTLRAVFISRVVPKKNLDGAIRVLGDVVGNVVFDVFGPLESDEYWAHCQAAARALPTAVSFAYRGELPHERIAETFADYDVFLFPTRGENYGHVIQEALSAGCIPVISDRTPWSGAQSRGAALVCPLDDDAAFRAALTRCIAADETEFARMRSAALAEVSNSSVREAAIEAHRRLFVLAAAR